MTGKTHFIVGVSSGVLLIRHGVVDFHILVPLVSGIGAYIPDMDTEKSSINSFIHMKKIYYAVLGAVLFYYSRNINTLILALALIWIGLSKHRGITHSIFAFPVLMFLTWPYTVLDKALIVGYASHLVSDATTERSVELLYPISSWKPKLPYRGARFIEPITFVIALGAIVGVDRIKMILQLVGVF